MTIVSGVTGFIGANFVLDLLTDTGEPVPRSLDALTYTGNLVNLKALLGDQRRVFVKGDVNGEIGDLALLGHLLG